MKQTIKILSILTMGAVLALAACSKEPNNNGGDNRDGETIDEWIDLGLPSGLLWASCNVGASSPEEFGSHFAWGETQPKEVYHWNTYQYCNGGRNQLTKYCPQSAYGYNGYTDTLTILQPGDDAATKAMGGGAHTPTVEEWRELLTNSTNVWTTQKGVCGRSFTGPNGKTLFMPTTGYRWDSEYSDTGSYGYYWTSSLLLENPDGAWFFYFFADDAGMSHYYYRGRRDYGFSVRPVRSAR